MQKGKIRVVIADDHPLIRLGLKKLFEGAADTIIVGEAANGREAIELVVNQHPDVLILDLQMPVMNGIQVLDYLQQCGSKVRVLVVSAFHDNQYTSEILTRGAWGYYLKEEAPTIIVDAVRQAARGDGQGTRPRPSPKLVSKLAGLG
jgi:DNA-binding NarL/FixJ family response regulator